MGEWCADKVANKDARHYPYDTQAVYYRGHIAKCSSEEYSNEGQADADFDCSIGDWPNRLTGKRILDQNQSFHVLSASFVDY